MPDSSFPENYTLHLTPLSNPFQESVKKSFLSLIKNNLVTMKAHIKGGMMMKNEMSYGEDYKFLPVTSIASGKGRELTEDVYQYTCQISNLYFIGQPASARFVLVDAGMPHHSKSIIKATEERFGSGSRPDAIILTHGHFDHVGSIIELIEHWEVPVYAHPLEFPYITGKQGYPAPDATAEGGMVVKMSPLFPVDPINLDGHVHPLPEDGTVPFLPDFQWIHVPGHTPGQIALFREKDRLLLAADAFVTVKQEDLYKVMTQKKEISGPPRYLTPDWKAAKESVQKLAALNPHIVGTGHGLPMEGNTLKESLNQLASHFDEIAVPDYGRFVDQEKKE